MRTIVDLPEKQIQALARLGKRAKLSRAELLRRAVAEYLSRHQSDDEDAAFGLWKTHDEDGVDYQDRLRSEWDQ